VPHIFPLGHLEEFWNEKSYPQKTTWKSGREDITGIAKIYYVESNN
jgi:hypothetical protein